MQRIKLTSFTTAHNQVTHLLGRSGKVLHPALSQVVCNRWARQEQPESVASHVAARSA